MRTRPKRLTFGAVQDRESRRGPTMSARHTYFDQETSTELIDYSMEVEGLTSPDQVLNRLHDITSKKNPIRVLGANRFSIKASDWRRIAASSSARTSSSIGMFHAGGWRSGQRS